MNIEDTKSDLRLARPLTDRVGPRREVLTLPDGYRTSVYVHDARDSGERPPVVYLHGIQSHPGWFAGSAAALADCGHQVWQPIRRGSGLSRDARGDARSAGQLLDDVDVACRLAAERSGASRVNLLGVSWGGKLAACYVASHHRTVQIASLTLIAPGIVPQVDVSAGTKLAIVMSLLACPKRQFDIPLSDVELFTDNEHMRQYLREDPHRLARATARFFYASRQLDRMLRRAKCQVDFPATLILADRDRIINNPATRAVVKQLAGELLEIAELPGAHTLEFEPDPEPFYQTLRQAVGRGQSEASR